MKQILENLQVKTIFSNFSNVHVVLKGQSAVIFDAGCQVEFVKTAVGNAKVEAIFLTHLHYDHVFYLMDYVNTFGCKVFLFNKRFVTNKNYTLENFIPLNLLLPKNCYESLENTKLVNLNNFSVECFHTPGHSADSMCFKIENCFFAGDTIFLNSIGRTDLFLDKNKKMKNSLNKIKNIKFEQCFSGHGKNSTWEEQQKNISYFLQIL